MKYIPERRENSFTEHLNGAKWCTLKHLNYNDIQIRAIVYVQLYKWILSHNLSNI